MTSIAYLSCIVIGLILSSDIPSNIDLENCIFYVSISGEEKVIIARNYLYSEKFLLVVIISWICGIFYIHVQLCIRFEVDVDLIESADFA